jgi:16S rRNA (cytosine967-C5)-methyltransferase
VAIELNAKKFRSQIKSCNNALRTVLETVFAQKKPADRTLSGFFRENRQLGSRDRQFISESVYALLRHWGVLRRFLPEERRAELESGVIRIGRVELEALLFAALYLDGSNLPAADAIAKELNIPWPKPKLDSPSPFLGKADALAAIFGVDVQFCDRDLLPNWVFDLLPADFPLERFLTDLLRRPPMWLRIQTPDLDRLSTELQACGSELRKVENIPNALGVVQPKVNLFTLESFRRGEFEVQDLASQCIGLVAAPKPGERWLDACAGAGGKTLELAELMKRSGTVVACDVRSYKLDDLRVRARRAGFPNIVTREWDGKPFKGKQAGLYDGVLVDSPCSCSGVWRRNPDGRWMLAPKDIFEMATLQQKILEAALSAVRPGGVLIYATCSLFPQENGEVVKNFLSNHAEFQLEKFAHPLTGKICDGTLQIYSFDGDCDSMFVARMRRSAEESNEAV